MTERPSGFRRRVAVGLLLSLLVAAAAAHAAGDPIETRTGTQLGVGPWQRLSHATSAKPHAAAFTRGFLATPQAMAFTIASPGRQAVEVFWSVYCEGVGNDSIFNQQGTLTRRPPFTGYPTLMPNASTCFVTVRATPTARITVRAATFGY